ncbi:MAG: SpoIIIAH-like family protein [Cohnella sp.]|nr:SpoIIIAH-like family protein [Cohnella sp.]
MNNRRQTIWLVSMLSLMVILSAYYLFTEPVSPTQNANNGSKQTGTQSDAAKASGVGNQGVQISEVDQGTNSVTDSASTAPDAAAPTDGKTNTAAADGGKTAGTTDATAAGGGKTAGTTDTTAAGGGKTAGTTDTTAAGNGSTDGTTGTTAAAGDKTAGKSGTAASDGAVSLNDQQVLKEMTNLKGSQYFDDLRRVGQENYAKAYEDLSKIVADTKNHTPDQASAAVEKMNTLEDADARMTSLEEKLLQDFDNAVVTEDATNFKIVVQAAKLDRKQAVQIIDQATKELKVTPDRLSLEFVP